ncbi:MAG: hypothetical protein JO270_03580 [Acidobacteriaceae bacterium]|nr:hypothetical protein [Acidobacteriaceae bacterium]
MGTKLVISDDILWGKLVKSWATGNNYICPDRPAPPVPRTMEDLLAQAADIGLIVTFPDGMVGLEIIQYSSQTAVIKLPPKSMVEATEAELLSGAQYPMPRFYDDFYGAPLSSVPPDRVLDLHAARIGDYSVRNCG